jgi:hypothetical protein
MAFTGSPTGSVQYNQLTGVTQGGAYGGETAGKLKASYFEYTHTAAAGAGTGEMNLVILPAGSILVYPFLSAHGVSVAWAASSTVQFGTRAYTQPDGTAVAQAVGALSTALAVGAATQATRVMDVPAFGQVLKLNSRSPGVTVFATVASGNITVGGTLFGWVTWADPS